MKKLFQLLKLTFSLIKYEFLEILFRFYIYILQKALHVRALRTFTDSFKRKRLHGEEWLVYASDTETYIPDVYEEVG
jgi:hypothetical protein